MRLTLDHLTASVAAAFFLTVRLQAASGTWTGGAGGTWDTSDLNWSGVSGMPWDSVEGATNSALFGTAGATPAVSGTVYANGLVFNAGATVSGGTISLAGDAPSVETPTGISATISSGLAGSAGLVKTGDGTLNFLGTKSYGGGTSVQGGLLQLQPGSSVGTGTLTLSGGSATFVGDTGVYWTFTNRLVVADGVSGTLALPPRMEMTGSLTGATNSTLTVTLQYVRDTITGNWSGFAGQLNLRASSYGEFRINNVNGLAVTRLDIGSGVLVHQVYNPPSTGTATTTQPIGELSGVAGGSLGGNPVLGRYVEWSVGGLNTSSTFGGRIINGTGAAKLAKVGTGTLTLAGTNTYTGGTSVNTGTLALDAIGAMTGSTLTLNSSPTSIFRSSGAATFTGAVTVGNNTSSENLLAIAGGTFSAPTVDVGRGGSGITYEPTAGYAHAGFYVSGGEVSITNYLNINGNNSTASCRIDGGTVSVGGKVVVGLGNVGRWSVLDVNGGSLAVAGAATGVQIGSNLEGSALLLVRAGTATTEKITFNRVGTTAPLAGVVHVKGGSLYIGSGGIAVTGTNESFTTTVRLASGVLGAAADWTSAHGVVLGTNPEIRAADAAGTAHDIVLDGVLSGTGFTKTGTGTLTLTGASIYGGVTTVSNGTLRLAGGNNRLPTTGAVTLKAAGVLDVSSVEQTVSALALEEGAVLRSTLAADGTCGRLTVSGSVTDADKLTIDVDPASLPSKSKFHTVMAVTSGTITGLPQLTGLDAPYIVKNTGTAIRVGMYGGSVIQVY